MIQFSLIIWSSWYSSTKFIFWNLVLRVLKDIFLAFDEFEIWRSVKSNFISNLSYDLFPPPFKFWRIILLFRTFSIKLMFYFYLIFGFNTFKRFFIGESEICQRKLKSLEIEVLPFYFNVNPTWTNNLTGLAVFQ